MGFWFRVVSRFARSKRSNCFLIYIQTDAQTATALQDRALGKRCSVCSSLHSSVVIILSRCITMLFPTLSLRGSEFDHRSADQGIECWDLEEIIVTWDPYPDPHGSWIQRTSASWRCPFLKEIFEFYIPFLARIAFSGSNYLLKNTWRFCCLNHYRLELAIHTERVRNGMTSPVRKYPGPLERPNAKQQVRFVRCEAVKIFLLE